jgi:hypothetical protein
MNKIKRLKFLIGLFVILYCFAACSKKDMAAQTPISAQLQSKDTAGVYYTNSKSAMYIVELINLQSKKVFTSVLYPNDSARKMPVPNFLHSGYYDVVITPEVAFSKVATNYSIGYLSGSAQQYPVTVKNVYVAVGNVADSVSIIFQ